MASKKPARGSLPDLGMARGRWEQSTNEVNQVEVMRHQHRIMVLAATVACRSTSWGESGERDRRLQGLLERSDVDGHICYAHVGPMMRPGRIID